MLESLPEEFQVVLKLHYLGNKSAEEIADLLKVPPDTVVRIIKQGRAILVREIGIQ